MLGAGRGELLLELRDAAVLQLGHARQIAGATRGFKLQACAVERFLDVLRAVHRGLLHFPDLVEVGVFLLQLDDLAIEQAEAFLRGLVGFLLQGHAFDLELDELAVELVHDLRLGVDLHADARRRLVHQVDSLVRQLAIGDVTVRERGGGDDRRISDVHAVMHFVFLFQAAQDGDGVLDAWLVHQHLLEAAFERGVFLDVLAILVERGGADAMQVAARQRRLEHVAGVHGALGLAGADHGVQLVDEQDDPPLLLGEIVEHRLEALLELAAVLGAGNERAHVERQHALALDAFRHLAIDNAQRQALDDRGLADARLADQHRVVLGAALQDLHHAPDLLVASDHRVELALLGALGEVDGVLLQGLALVLGAGVLHLLPAAQRLDGLVDAALRHTGLFQQPAELALVLQRREHEQLRGDVLVATLLRVFVGEIKEFRQVIGDVHLAAAAFHRGHAVQHLADLGAQGIGVHVGLGEQRTRGATILIQQRRQHVHRLDELVIAPDGQALRLGQRHLEFGGEFVHAHASALLEKSISRR